MRMSGMRQGIKFAGIAAKAATLRIFNREASRQYLLQAISAMPGLTAKTSQLLGMKLGLPSQSVVTIEPLPIAVVKSLIAEEAPHLANLIDDISENPIVASLGQVHQASLRDGRLVAIKVQYPGVDKDLLDQLEWLLRGASLGPAAKFGMDIPGYREFILQRFQQEIDYRLEAQVQSSVANIDFGAEIVVPRVDCHLTTQRVLVQSWEDAQTPAWASNLPYDEKRVAAELLARFFLLSLFREGILHCDFHPGNYGFRRAPSGLQLVLYDFGSTISVSLAHRLALLRWIDAYRGGPPIVPLDMLVFLGFNPDKLAPIAEQLPALCGKLVEPFQHPRAWQPSDWMLGNYVDNLLGSDSWWFRTAGPPWFLYLMKAVQGITHGLQELGVALPLQNLLRDSTVSIFKDASALNIPSASLKDGGKQPLLSSACARSFKVHVRESGRDVVALEFPVRMVDFLEDVIPPEAVLKITAAGYDLKAIKLAAQRQGYLPHLLFEAQSEAKTYKVWLE